MMAKTKEATTTRPAETVAEDAETKTNKPIEVRVGRALVKVWTNPAQEEGKTWRNLTTACLYQNAEEKWQESHSFGANDVNSLVAALEGAQNQVGTVGEEEALGWRAAVTTPSQPNQPTTVQVQNALVKIWDNSNEAGQKWQSATVASLYQKDGKMTEGHSFARRETAQLIQALREAEKQMVPAKGAVEETATEVETIVDK